jgi:hypothetical protein
MSDDDVLQNLREIQRHLRELENQFDNAQGNLRTAGSVWTLAGIGGLGGAAALDLSHTHLAEYLGCQMPEALMSFVCFLVVLGLLNLWSVDQFVYQRLLHSAYGYGMVVEEYLKPPERMRQAITAHVGDVTNRLSAFYAMPIVVFLALFFVLNLMQLPAGWTLANAILWVLFAGSAFYALRLFCKSLGDDVTVARKEISDHLTEIWHETARPLAAAPPPLRDAAKLSMCERWSWLRVIAFGPPKP